MALDTATINLEEEDKERKRVFSQRGSLSERAEIRVVRVRGEEEEKKEDLKDDKKDKKEKKEAKKGEKAGVGGSSGLFGRRSNATAKRSSRKEAATATFQ